MGLSVVTTGDLFRGMGPAELERVSSLFTERSYPRGGTIFSRGDPGDALFVVKEGLVKLVSHSGRGTETIVHLLPPGAVFGELLLSENKRAFTALAGRDCRVSVLPLPSLTLLLSTTPAFSMNFIRMLSRRLAKVETDYAGFGHTWSYHRLAMTLLRLGEEHGIETPAGTAIALRLTHDDLANLIGTTRETVTTQMARFRRMGMVRGDGRTLLLNAPLLSKFARGEPEPGKSPGTSRRRRSS
jgi:CRP/FNR family transcriptional regulator